jgi:thiamine biosynthesis lipoprotein
MIRFFEFRAMNTSVLLAAEGDGATAGMQVTRAFIDQCEQRFSRFLPASELSELNRSTGDWFDASKDLMEMLLLSAQYHKETRGLFDPSILPDLKRAGYDRSLDELRANGGRAIANTAARTARPAFADMIFDASRNRVWMPRGLELDLGGIAKGWIVEKAAHLLQAYAETCAVSAGGDILFIGRPRDGSDWDVYLEDPRDPAQMLAQLHIPSGAVATSSVMKRTWSQGEQVRHHIIDPRTGAPAETGWLSMTVLTPDILAAEVYAKAILIAGEKEAIKLLKAKTDMTWIAVDRNGNLTGSPGYREYLYELTSDELIAMGLVH